MTLYREEWVDIKQVTEETAEEVAAWCGGQVVHEIDGEDSSVTHAGVNVPTALAGVKRASSEDWVSKNVYDEFNVVKAHEYDGK